MAQAHTLNAPARAGRYKGPEAEANTSEGTAQHDTHGERPTIDTDRQQRVYGGFHFGSAFFGWLVAAAVASLLTALLVAAGSTVALTSNTNVHDITNNAAAATETAKTVGLVGGIALLLATAVAYYAGGYVAGRMARFDGARQGLGVWIMGLAVMVLLAIAGATLGANFNLLSQINLPHIPINEGQLTKGGLLTIGLSLVVTLVAAIIGGKMGERYHHKVDRAGMATD